MTFVTALEQGEPADFIQIDLYAGYGVFPGPITPGTYELSGDELDFALCGACVRIFTNVDSTGAFDGVYMPTGGTLTVSAAGNAVGGEMTGTISNLTFQHVDIADDATTTPVGDDCSSALSAASFSGTLEAPPE